MSSFYSEEELKAIGFKSIGKDVLISRKTSIYQPGKMVMGDHVRIDDFCYLSGRIELGNYIHIAPYCALYGGEEGIFFDSFSTVSSRNALYAHSDDYSGDFMTNPTTPEEFRNRIEGRVSIGKHVIVGSGCTVFPGVSIGEGAAVGAMSLINRSLDPWGIYCGIPCRKLKDRSRKLLEYEEKLYKEHNG
ncbi:MAG: acyltransferase [Lachnospiraceae bacterium]|nr:acyltransferase [Lachnospiraceae bacterium]